MATIDALKEETAPPTPLFVFDCLLASGSTERWSTHAVTVSGNAYPARLLKHNAFALQASADVSITLANADSHFSEIERETGFRGSQVTITFLFYDLVANAAASETRVIFQGIGNTADEITESGFRVTFTNRLNLSRIVLPEVNIQRHCPWMFPTTAAQRLEAMTGGPNGIYSDLYRCGYSADQTGGVGNLNSGVAFTTCDYTRANCVARGMFSTDASSTVTARFGGLEFVPAQILVRSFGEHGSHLSPEVDNLALYNDYVPLVYGTAWYQPRIAWAFNDGNLTHMEVVLGMGPISAAVTVLVNDIEIPIAVAGTSMTATGWYDIVSPGTRSGAFDLDFTDSLGNPLGDPFGSIAYMSIVVPNRISTGVALATVKILLQGLQLEQFDTTGTSLGASFTNNPAWVLLDVLRRSGWLTTNLDLISFAAAAEYCAETIETTDLYGNSVLTPRFECNLTIESRRSAAEVAKGIKLGSSLILASGSAGLLTLQVENTLALQQSNSPDGTNSTEPLNGGWPAYEFSDGSAAFSGLLRKPNGEPAIRLYSKNGADVPNRLTVEFQDEYNGYQQDSLSLVDATDALLTGRDVTAAFQGIGLPNFDQAARMLQLQLSKSIDGNVLVEFQTTVKGIGIAPGDLITVTYLKEGLARQPFRVVQLAPGLNYQTVQVTAQWHDDDWYTTGGAGTAGGSPQGGAGVGLPRPLVGSLLDVNGIEQFGIAETDTPTVGGGFTATLTVAFDAPVKPQPSGANIPLVSLSPAVSSTGGTIAGGQTLYYAVSALDGSGAESGLSFTMMAVIPSGANTNSVTLTGFSFSTATAGFNVYRGPNPSELLEIATNVTVASSYADSGVAATLTGPPDANYDHANFYWRLELQPEVGVNLESATTIGNSTLGMLTNNFIGALVRITRGTGAAQESLVVNNSSTTLTVTPAWSVTPDSTSFFVVAQATWNFAGLTATSPALVAVAFEPGATVEISGRSANALNQESAYELNPLTRWQIESGGGVDSGTPPQPVFGLNLPGQGAINLVSVGFTTLVNTHTIMAGTLSLFSWNELNSPTGFTLASAAASTDATITVSPAGTTLPGDLIQIDAEILEVSGTSGGGTIYAVSRGSHGSTAAAHLIDRLVYHLTRTVTIVPFVNGFFGSPASGSYSMSIFLPDVRVGAAEFFVTNSFGGGPVAVGSYGATTDEGLRTLAGGQMSIQVEGYLANQTDAAPPLVVESALAMRDMFAVVNEAPSGGPISLQLRQGSTVFGSLTIADGTTTSNVVDGFGLPALAAGSQVSLDILSVPTASGTLPGSDLTVIIRL
jgi:Putative phage tail protein